MTIMSLADFPPTWQSHILATLAALENADEPILEKDHPGLHDPSLRAAVELCLGELGRVLVTAGGGFLSGYRNDIGERLAAEGIGILQSDDRAVLTLVILHSLAIPRASGRIGSDSWVIGEPVPRPILTRSRVPDSRINASVQRLRDAGLLRSAAKGQLMPGHQIARLTPATVSRIWENLVLLAEPDGILADGIRRRRHAARVGARPESTGESR